jgi:hypothetical protein
MCEFKCVESVNDRLLWMMQPLRVAMPKQSHSFTLQITRCCDDRFAEAAQKDRFLWLLPFNICWANRV